MSERVEKLRLRERASISVVRGEQEGPQGPRHLRLPIKQYCDVELFRGEEPVYRSANGASVTRQRVKLMGPEELMRLGAIPMTQEIIKSQDLQDLSFVGHGLLLPVRNRNFLERTHNTITTVGFNWVADRLANDDGTGLDIAAGGMEIGNVNTTPSLGDDDVLGNLGVSGEFQNYASGYPVDGGTSVQWQSFWAAGQGTANGIKEVVIKTNSSATTEGITRIIFGSIDKAAADTLQITITWNLAEG